MCCLKELYLRCITGNNIIPQRICILFNSCVYIGGVDNVSLRYINQTIHSYFVSVLGLDVPYNRQLLAIAIAIEPLFF